MIIMCLHACRSTRLAMSLVRFRVVSLQNAFAWNQLIYSCQATLHYIRRIDKQTLDNAIEGEISIRSVGKALPMES